jgi:hypothetical protein
MTAQSVSIVRATVFGLAVAGLATALSAQPRRGCALPSDPAGAEIVCDVWQVPDDHPIPTAKPTIVDVLIASKTVTFAKGALAETVCFEADCLSLKDLRALVAARHDAPAPSLSAFTQTQQTADAFRAAYGKSQADLGDCQSQLGPWTKIGGAIAAGTSMLIDMPTIRAKVEAQNPGKSLDASWKIIDKSVTVK